MRSNRLQGAGFTLIEMMVVIAVLGIIMGVLAQYRPQQDRWLETRGAADRVAAVMREDHGRAIAAGRAVPLALPELPGWLAVRVAAPAGGIVFEPDGSTTGGLITLGSARPITISADWLTGRISVAAP